MQQKVQYNIVSERYKGFLVMEIIEVQTDKKKYMDLLLLADEQEDMIDRHLERGAMFVLDDDGVKAECVVTAEPNGVLEIKNIATNPTHQRKGYGRIGRGRNLMQIHAHAGVDDSGPAHVFHGFFHAPVVKIHGVIIVESGQIKAEFQHVLHDLGGASDIGAPGVLAGITFALVIHRGFRIEKPGVASGDKLFYRAEAFIVLRQSALTKNIPYCCKFHTFPLPHEVFIQK